MSHIFLSYSHEDAHQADEIGKLLDELGIGFFRDVKNATLGDAITPKIREELEGCAAVLVILSPASLKSHWVPYEVGQATALGKKVLPYIQHRSSEIFDYLRDLVHAKSMDELRNYLDGPFREEMNAAAQRSARAFLDTFRSQVTDSPFHRRNLKVSVRFSQHDDGRIVRAHVNYNYDLVNRSNENAHPVIIYRCPEGFPEKGFPGKMIRCTATAITPSPDVKFEFSGNELKRYLSTDKYGVYYDFPTIVHPGEEISVSQEAHEHYGPNDSLYFYSHYPSSDMRVDLHDAQRFRIKVRFYHPAKYGQDDPDNVESTVDGETLQYMIHTPLLPFQGIRIWWQPRSPE